MTESDLSVSTSLPPIEELARYKRFAEGSGYGFWEWNLQTQSVVLIGSLWRQLGYSDEQIQAVSDSWKLAQLIHPDDRRPIRFNLRSQLKYGVPLLAECRLRAEAGGYVWTQLRANAKLGDDGRVELISGIVFDITALKRAEEALRESQGRQERIIAASNDGLWEWEAGKSGLHFSARCWEILGYSENDDDHVPEGMDRWHLWRSYMHPDDLIKFDRALERHHKYQEPFDVEYRIYGRDGELRWIRARGKCAYDSNGAPVRMSGTNMDITSLKLAEEKVRQAKEAAEQANKAKSDFLSSMSHELRTPLNAILGFAQLFDYDSGLTEEQQQNVREIRKAGQHLLKLIGDVLDLSKVEAGRMTLSLEPVLAARVLRECQMLTHTLAENKGVYLALELGELTERYVRADAMRLKQVLLNLVSNGIKYNRAGGEVVVSLSPVYKGAELARVRIEVKDTGPGIPLAKQSQVFQPFNRLGAEGGRIEGSGVGLVITQRLIEMMDSEIQFESVEGEGSRFWFELPVMAEWSLAERRAHIAEKAARAEVLTVAGQHRVLYIEDNPSNIRLMEQIFERFAPLELEVAEESFQGLFQARTNPPDVVILDINLPGLDGFEVLKVLKQDPATRDVPVLGLSANAMPYDIQRGLDAGFSDYLTKPVEIDRLIAALNKLLG